MPCPCRGWAAWPCTPAFVITVLVVAWPLDRQTLGLLLGATLLVVFIVVDDLRGLRPRDKFLAQLAAAAVPLLFGVRIDAVSNPFEAGVILLHVVIVIPFTLFWITGMMNAINFVDGLDGLAGGVVTIAAIALVALSLRLGLPETATLALALVAVVLGFLPFNAYRSSIIMGDAGSNFPGLCAGGHRDHGSGQTGHRDPGAGRSHSGHRLVHRPATGQRAGGSPTGTPSICITGSGRRACRSRPSR